MKKKETYLLKGTPSNGRDIQTIGVIVLIVLVFYF